MITKKWIITMSGDHPTGDVKKKLAETGFSVEQVLDEIGSITGSSSDEVAEQLRAIPGVADVSPDTDIQLPPPDQPHTW